ncbi:hypothetical protein BKA67DRAFT_400113 [Truncatella angustata]|uniref:Uncharacterized protein n=1 Tax=Truncatella angustata TaxID=152316 RepID=A0A9P8RQD8_9PEZI|nr:uncharacterized protein BKA67DRAFT_400113 [Truncatella angustata]KAH6647882.1 hypothetical protein BKA67DRAFT_400113 [Truncatella angustata]
MWPEPAQNITERCATAAGMADDAPLKIITEPEAAGIFALDAMCREWLVEIGDTFVICDAGGGTVDLISYTISQLKPSPVLDEAAPGVGKLYGSSFLDRNFNDWLLNKFAGYHRWTDDYHESAMLHWESEIKREFSGDPGDTYTFRVMGLPDDPARSIRSGVLEMTLAEVKSIFDPIIDKIVGLVKDQITQAKIKSSRDVKTVLLAGGFGSNAYLKARIKNAVGHGIEVKKMPNSTTAIVRGALIRGLADVPQMAANVPRPTIVRARFATSHIGTIALERYNPMEHGIGRKTVSGGLHGGKRIEVMRWLLHKNAVIEDDKGFDFPFVFDQAVSDVEQKGGKIDQLNLQIYYCQDDERPKFPDVGGTCKPLVTLPADFNQIPKRFLIKQPAADGQLWYKIPFMIVRTCRLANVHFDLVHLQENEDGTIIRKTYGSVKADPLSRMTT